MTVIECLKIIKRIPKNRIETILKGKALDFLEVNQKVLNKKELLFFESEKEKFIQEVQDEKL